MPLLSGLFHTVRGPYIYLLKLRFCKFSRFAVLKAIKCGFSVFILICCGFSVLGHPYNRPPLKPTYSKSNEDVDQSCEKQTLINGHVIVEQIQNLGLDKVCPTRKTKGGNTPTITASGTAYKKEDRFKPWNAAESIPSQQQERLMFKEALRIGLDIVMRNHVYRFDNCIRQQQKGGPIGLELTGNIAQVYMIWWDQQLKLRLDNLGLLVAMYKRYVDDINIAAKGVPLGTRYVNGELILDQNAIESDKLIPGDKRTMEIIKCVGNDIHPSIQLEVDCPSNYDDGKLPILDLKVWIAVINGCNRMVHEFYSKDISSKAVIHAKSALPWQQKRTVLTQEMLRVMLNCSEDVPWEIIVKHVDKMVLRLQFSGYTQKFRHEVVNAALKAYDEIGRKVSCGERPRYRPYEWMREERDAMKKEKAVGWYKRGGYESVIFVPSTPNSLLQRRYQAEIDRQGIKIRIVEKAGRSVKSLLQRSDPFKERICSREGCFVCHTEKKGSCDKNGVNYVITCTSCEDVYHGETSKNAYTRGKQHLDEYNNKAGKSVMWRHCRERHENVLQEFKMRVTGQYRNDAMLRQIAEAVRINDCHVDKRINNKTEWNLVLFPTVRVDNGDTN